MKSLSLFSPLLCASSLLLGAPAQAKSANIILFFVDDLGWQDSSVPFHSNITTQNKTFHTPNMERLAAKGVKFTQAYGCPLSSPARASLLTGNNTSRHHITTVSAGAPQDAGPAAGQGQGPRGRTRAASPLEISGWNSQGLSVEKNPPSGSYGCIPLPQILKKAGYCTYHVGKGHFGKRDTAAADPRYLGFDVSRGGSAAGGPGSYLGLQNFAAANGRQQVPNLEAYHGQDIFLTEALTQEACKLMDKALAEQKPFFLYLAHYGVHTPHDKDKRYYDKYIQAGLSEEEASYAALVEGVDKSLGDIMNYLNDKRISDDTVVLFMSDNGGAARGLPRENRFKPSPNAPLRAQKGSLYEGGIREPMLAFVPGLTRGGSTNTSPLQLEDFYPTILQLAGAQKYAPHLAQIDGKSFVAALAGKEINQERPLYWHYPHQRSGEITDNGMASSAIRQGDMKLIHYYMTETNELYKLSEDIGEQNNLAESSPENKALAAKLAKMLSDKLKAEKSPLPYWTEFGYTCPYPDGSEQKP